MASFAVTLYKLFLADEHSTTKQYNMGYSEHNITMAIFPRAVAGRYSAIGKLSMYDQIGFTAYDVHEGDVVKDSSGRHFELMSVEPWILGDEFIYNQCGLQRQMYFNLPQSASTFYGFENLLYNIIGNEFADGFERGYFTETTY